MPFAPRHARRWMNEHLTRQKPELVPDYDSMVTACEIAADKGTKCTLEELGPLHDGIVHQYAKIWHDACALARFLSRRGGPIFDVLQRVIEHPKAAKRQRVFQCVYHKSLREATLSLLEQMTKDKAANSRICAYWTLVRFEQRKLKPKLAGYRESETSEKCLAELVEIEKLVDDGYLVQNLEYEWLTSKCIDFTAFARHGLHSISMDEEEFNATSIESLRKRCWNT